VTLIYCVLMMEAAGTIFLDIVFEQFTFELINEQPERRKVLKQQATPYPLGRPSKNRNSADMDETGGSQQKRTTPKSGGSEL